MGVRTALIGHRGVGKSSCLRRIETYATRDGRRVLCLDLDAEIARRLGRAPGDIFAMEGEARFRDEEKRVFSEIDRETASSDVDVYLALGGGFDLAALPQAWRALWIRRAGDEKGRIFVGGERPRLNPRVSPLAEFLERFHERDQRYRGRADEILFVDEGLEDQEAAEGAFFADSIAGLGGAITVAPILFRRPGCFAAWAERRLKWGVRWFELRDDLLTEQEMIEALARLPGERVLLSFRSLERQPRTAALLAGHAFDWPLEFGPCPLSPPPTVHSLHERIGDLEKTLERLAAVSPDGILKAALPVADFTELAIGHAWQGEDPARRAFLPLSVDGRWAWYRLLQVGRAPLGFFREGDGSGADQPTLLQWVRRRSNEGEAFAAVLGDPVAHSRTPLEQADFFGARGVSVFGVRVTRAEWSEGALEVLRAMGLRWAAVTAPLKELAYEACAEVIPLARDLAAVNTLAWSEDGWRGANTDLEGFCALIAGENLGEAVIWGGGGTLKMICSALPTAISYSARSGESRDSERTIERPDVVIWAAGSESRQPPEVWRPRLVIDLSYTEDSPARAFAMNKGARYVSGLGMFRVQAKGQREFWKGKV